MHPGFATCSGDAVKTYFGICTHADDGGRLPDEPISIKMGVFPASACTPDDVAGWIDELVAAGVVERYEVDGKPYVASTGWTDGISPFYQKIDQPTFRYPAPDGNVPKSPTRRRPREKQAAAAESVGDRSPNAPGTPAERSPPPLPADADGSPPERKGRRSRAERSRAENGSRKERTSEGTSETEDVYGRLTSDVNVDAWLADCRTLRRDLLPAGRELTTQRVRDLDLIHKAVLIVHQRRMPANWLWGARDAVKHATTRPRKPMRYFNTVLDATAKDAGESRDKLLAETVVPKDWPTLDDEDAKDEAKP